MAKKSDTVIYDINKMCDFIFGNPNDKTNEVEITESYTFDKDKNEMIPTTKQIKEVKVNDYTGQNTMRYDLIKMFIEILNDIEDPKTMTLGEQITLNTLEAYELIKDIKELKDNE